MAPLVQAWLPVSEMLKLLAAVLLPMTSAPAPLFTVTPPEPKASVGVPVPTIE